MKQLLAVMNSPKVTNRYSRPSESRRRSTRKWLMSGRIPDRCSCSGCTAGPSIVRCRPVAKSCWLPLAKVRAASAVAPGLGNQTSLYKNQIYQHKATALFGYFGQYTRQPMCHHHIHTQPSEKTQRIHRKKQ